MDADVISLFEPECGDELICTSYTWHQLAQGITLTGATPVFAGINFWNSSLSPNKGALKVSPRTQAILAGNTNGQPVTWATRRKLAIELGLKLIEDITEAFGLRYQDRTVVSFGDVSVFDFSAPSALCTGEGAGAAIY